MTTKTQSREMPVMYHRAAIQSIDVEQRTFDVVFATNNEVEMWNWDRGAFIEVLKMNPENVRLNRINAGAPLLDNHMNGGARAVLGAVVRGSAKVDGTTATATIKVSNREDVNGIFQDIQDGILSTVSVGYIVHRATLVDTGRNVYHADDWEPYEISMAPIPADINAQVRASENRTMFSAEISGPGEEDPDNTVNTEQDFRRDMDHIELIRTRYINH